VRERKPTMKGDAKLEEEEEGLGEENDEEDEAEEEEEEEGGVRRVLRLTKAMAMSAAAQHLIQILPFFLSLFLRLLFPLFNNVKSVFVARPILHFSLFSPNFYLIKKNIYNLL